MSTNMAGLTACVITARFFVKLTLAACRISSLIVFRTINMSLETRINGMTAWANFRLQIAGHSLMKNIVTDFMKGCNLKVLVECVTGKPFRKLKTFDGLSLAQKETRIRWVVEELKENEVMGKSVDIDYRQVASRIANEVFEFFWHIVCHDIQFIWLRSDFLQGKNYKKIVKHLLNFIPPSSKNGNEGNFVAEVLQSKQSLSEAKISSYKAALRRDIEMISDKKIKMETPSASKCIFSLINTHLKMTKDGQKLKEIRTFADLIDSRVLCALLNSIVPDSVTSEVLLNDRWTVNLSLELMMEISRCTSSFHAEDLVQADPIAIGSYFAFFFMSGYTLYQARAVAKRMETLMTETNKRKEEYLQFPAVLYKLQDLERVYDKSVLHHTVTPDTLKKKEVEELLEQYKDEMLLIQEMHKVEECVSWMKEIRESQEKFWATVGEAMIRKYEVIHVQTSCTVKELTSSHMINLSLTSDCGYYESRVKEMISKDRQVIVMNRKTGRFYDSTKKCNNKKCLTARQILKFSNTDNNEVNSANYPEYVIFLEALSNNKMLKSGSQYVYKIFTGDFSNSQNVLFRAIRDRELDTVKNIISFFKADPSFLNGPYGDACNTPLHVACKCSSFQIVLYLLEQNAFIDALNGGGNTPLFLAAEGCRRDISKLLIEWEVNINVENKAGVTVMKAIRNKNFRQYLESLVEYWSKHRTKLLEGDLQVLNEVIDNNIDETLTLSTLRTRCVRGSTLLHVASYYGDVASMKKLLSRGLDVNIRDHKQATALHRAKTPEAIEVLREFNVDLNVTDQDGNTSLHVRCYGEYGKVTDTECIEELVRRKVDVFRKNKKGLLPIHCASIQGRTDAIRELVLQANGNIYQEKLNAETTNLPPSVVYLAAANDFLLCAQWLTERDFHFKGDEVIRLLEKILMDQHSCENPSATVEFLIKNKGPVDLVFPGNNTALHLCASHIELYEVIEFLLNQQFDINALNEDYCCPLHFAVSANNLHGASILISHGANMLLKSNKGLCPFDLIKDFDQWINFELFDKETKDLLEAFSMKQARELVKSITQKVNRVQINRLHHSSPSNKAKIM